MRRRLARTPETPPAADEVVWHLRLGDTVDCDDAFEKPCARNAKYVLQRPFFEAVAARLRPRSVITLIYATQHAGCKDAHRTPPARSRAYVSAAIQLLRSRGFEVRERADGDPDADMTYMCRARTLVLAGGGYTRLAGECARAFDAGRAPGDGARARRAGHGLRRAAPGLSEQPPRRPRRGQGAARGEEAAGVAPVSVFFVLLPIHIQHHLRGRDEEPVIILGRVAEFSFDEITIRTNSGNQTIQRIELELGPHVAHD